MNDEQQQQLELDRLVAAIRAALDDQPGEDLLKVYVALIHVELFMQRLPEFDDYLARIWTERFQTNLTQFRGDIQGLTQAIAQTEKLHKSAKKRSLKRPTDQTIQ